jgi:hypothetical protein
VAAFEKAIPKSRISLLLSLLFVAGPVLAGETAVPRDGPRLVTVEDSIGLTEFPESSAGPVFSPDRERFVVITKTGNLTRNTVDYSLLLWRSASVFRSSAATVLARFSSSSNRDAIRNVRWLTNDVLTFLAERPGQERQLYSLNVVTRRLRQLTRQPTSLIEYCVAPDGRTIAFASERVTRRLSTPEVQRNGFRVTTQGPAELVAGVLRSTAADLFVQRRSERAGPPIPLPGDLSGTNEALLALLSLSPDGRFLIAPIFVSAVPNNWKTYRHPYLATGFVNEFVLIDTTTGQGAPLIDAPIGWNPSNLAVVWAPDSRSAVVSDVFLPLGSGDPAEDRARQSDRFTVEVHVPDRTFTKIGDSKLHPIHWNATTGQVRFRIPGDGKSGEGKGRDVFFAKEKDRWIRRETRADPEEEPLSILLEESFDTPPRVLARDAATGRSKILLSLDPNLANLRLGTIEEVRWAVPDGGGVAGGLLLPPDHAPGRKYPLVIQTHGWRRNKFSLCGYAPTAFAAQPLAAAGFVILQADMNFSEWDLLSPAGTQNEVSSYEAAIDDLDRRGLIDRNRVGLIGFSHTGHTVKYALAHSRYPIAAAVVADGTDASYYQYLSALVDFPIMASQLELLNGGVPPFGEGLASWMRLSPGFALDRVRTPLLIQALSRNILDEWEWFAGLTRLRKPVDMIYLPGSAHVLVRPWEQRTSQQATVDWFRFWLKNEEDPNPAKAPQYDRWRKLKGLHAPDPTRASE